VDGEEVPSDKARQLLGRRNPPKNMGGEILLKIKEEKSS
jgi:hypothetical protein